MSAHPPTTDVLVIGAGPAGSIAALVLARAGVSVRVIDRAQFPRDKICGDGLIPDALSLLADLGIDEGVLGLGHRAAGVRFHGPDGDALDLDLPMWTVRRERLDHALVEQAVGAGALLEQGLSARGIECDADGVTVQTDDGPRQAALVIVCTGASEQALQGLGVEHAPQPSAIAARAYWTLGEHVPEHRLQIWFERALLPGYAWVFPMGERVFNVGVGAFLDAGAAKQNLRHLHERFEKDTRTGAETLRDGTMHGRLRGAPLRTGLARAAPSAERTLVAGEAIGATYPLSGEGIGKAMETGRLAAEHALVALRTGQTDARSLAAYDEALEALRPWFDGYAAAQRWMRWPWVASLITRRAIRNERLRTALVEIVGEQRAASDVLSVCGLSRVVLGL